MIIPISLAVVSLSVAVAVAAYAHGRPPSTRRDDIVDHLHGIDIADPYRWLEDQESPETRAWIGAQMEYCCSVLSPLPERVRLADRMERFLRVERIGVPVSRGGRLFYSRRRPEDEQAVLYWRVGRRGRERLLLDPNPLSDDRTTTAVLMDINADGSVAAIGVRRGGEDEVEVRFVEVKSGDELGDRLARGHIESVSLTPDGRTVYYSKLEPLIGRRIYLHRLSDDPAADELVFGTEYGPEDMVGQALSENGRWLIIAVYRGWTQNDLFVQDLQSGDGIRPLVAGLPATFTPIVAGDRLYVLTDFQAPRRRILEASLAPINAVDDWTEVVPEGEDTIEGASAAAGRLFVARLHNVATELTAYTLEGACIGPIEMPEQGTATLPSGAWAGSEAYFSFSSFTEPGLILRYDSRTGGSHLWNRIRTGFRSRAFVTRHLWATSQDGTAIPIFLVHRKGLRMNGDRPTRVTAYGGFGVSLTPWFDPEMALWIEDGGVVAVPALRGGGEFGEAWHRAGMLDQKQTVFDDLQATLRYLIAEGITCPDRLAITGGSNGGLLVGAALCQFPELFSAAVCEVPLLDMLRYHRFLQGPQWVPEYGSAEDPAYFEILHAYSPYHNIRADRAYPAVLFATGDADTRVAPLHARKMTALLQGLEHQRRPILLYYETSVGHSGGEPVASRVQRRSHVLAFLYHETGLRSVALAPTTRDG